MMGAYKYTSKNAGGASYVCHEPSPGFGPFFLLRDGKGWAATTNVEAPEEISGRMATRDKAVGDLLAKLEASSQVGEVPAEDAAEDAAPEGGSAEVVFNKPSQDVSPLVAAYAAQQIQRAESAAEKIKHDAYRATGTMKQRLEARANAAALLKEHAAFVREAGEESGDHRVAKLGLLVSKLLLRSSVLLEHGDNIRMRDGVLCTSTGELVMSRATAKSMKRSVRALTRRIGLSPVSG